MISFNFIIVLSVILLAYLYPKLINNPAEHSRKTNEQIISAWQSEIKRPEKGFSRVSAGINACVDLIVRGTDLMQALNIQPAGKHDHDKLDSVEHLQESFHHFFSKGSAAERFFANSEQFTEVIKSASSLDKAEWHVGGNAALIAHKISDIIPDVELQLVGPVGPKTKELLNKKIQVPASSLQDQDEVHLIMEYHVGDTWGESSAPVATRFITSSDASNSGMTSLPTFFASIAEYRPDLVIFSGLHMLDGQEASFQQQRLSEVAEGFRQLPDSLPIHLELASLASAQLMSSIFKKVLPEVTALGLNEQELSFASSCLGGPHADLFTQSAQPEIHKVTDIIAWVLKNYGRSRSNPGMSLTRVHFHSLTYHVIGTLPGTWGNVAAAVAAGTRMAGQQACDAGEIDPESVQLRIPARIHLYPGDTPREFNPEAPVISYTYSGFEFAFSPVLVCKQPLKTVGLGDAISATGLLYSYRIS